MARRYKLPPSLPFGPLSSEQAAILDQAAEQILALGGPATQEFSSLLGKALNRSFIEACLRGEMKHHLDSEADVDSEEGEDAAIADDCGTKRGNKRNGYSRKNLRTDAGDCEIRIPRDRNGSFEPLIVPKHSRALNGLNKVVIGLYGRGMTLHEIRELVYEQYGMDVSEGFISDVTDSINKDVQEWRFRPLQAIYPVALFDAIRISIRDSGVVKKMAMHLAIGIDCSGRRDVLGMWIHENESASNWETVFSELQSRGVQDIFIAVTDGLTGMTTALESVFPKTVHQTCIVHLIRNSVAFVNWRDRQAVCNALKEIYGAPNDDAAKAKLDEFAQSELGQKYPAVAKKWRAAWSRVIPFFDFPPAIRKLIYTTNAIESLNRAIRKIIKNRAVFPTMEAAYKLVFLAIKNITSKWSRANRAWSDAMPVFAAVYGERFTNGVEDAL